MMKEEDKQRQHQQQQQQELEWEKWEEQEDQGKAERMRGATTMKKDNNGLRWGESATLNDGSKALIRK
eukprot:9280094-Pyramimonas_sp.AAC.1